MKTQYLYSADGKERGIITNTFERLCTVCQKYCTRLSVKWPDGKRTFNCARATKSYRGHLKLY